MGFGGGGLGARYPEAQPPALGEDGEWGADRQELSLQAVGPPASVGAVLAGPPDLPGLQPPARPGERGGQAGSEACCKDERLLGGCRAGPLSFSVLRDHSCRLRGGPEPSGYFLRASDAARQSLDEPGLLGSSGPHSSSGCRPSSTLAHSPSYLPSMSPKARGIELGSRTMGFLAWH